MGSLFGNHTHVKLGPTLEGLYSQQPDGIVITTSQATVRLINWLKPWFLIDWENYAILNLEL